MKIAVIFVLFAVIAVFDGLAAAQAVSKAADPSPVSSMLDSPLFAPFRNVIYLAKNAVVGVPFALVLDVANLICHAGITYGVTQPLQAFTAQADHVALVLKAGNKSIRAPLSRTQTIWNAAEFDKSKPTVIVSSGFLTELDDYMPAIYSEFLSAFGCRDDVNVMMVDTGDFIDTLYGWSVHNTKRIGVFMGNGLAELTEKYNYTGKIHLIGHSLGAHICGAAGKQYHLKTGKLVARISAMDTASPCFYGGHEQVTSLSTEHAEFVDALHTNPGGLGVLAPIGHVDVYANGDLPVQPGTMSIVGSHDRSWELYAETVWPDQSDNFVCHKCESGGNIEAAACTGAAIPFGYNVPLTARGTYFMSTNGYAPFGTQAVPNFTPVCAAA